MPLFFGIALAGSYSSMTYFPMVVFRSEGCAETWHGHGIGFTKREERRADHRGICQEAVTPLPRHPRGKTAIHTALYMRRSKIRDGENDLLRTPAPWVASVLKTSEALIPALPCPISDNGETRVMEE